MAAVFVLTVIAALVAAGAFAALQEFRIGRNSVLAIRAREAAEAGLLAALARWEAGGLGRLDSAGAEPFAGDLPGETGSFAGTVLRLNARLFLVRSTGRPAAGAAWRSVAAVVRLVPPRLDVRAALTAQGAVELGPGSRLDGLSASPAAWSCAAPADTAAGLALPDSARLSLTGCALGDCVRGEPALLVDSALRNSGVPVLGDSVWARLSAGAESLLAGGGPPRPPPGGALPVVHAAGSLELDGGTGEGILLVDGDLTLAGGVRLTGLVVVRGALRAVGEGGEITGAAVVGAAHLSSATGGVSVRYSGCAVERALEAAAPARPLLEWGAGEGL